MILRESPYQSIEVSPKRPISKQEIYNLMNIARRTRTYVKFTVSGGKYYIMVTYHRNGLVSIQSNIRFDDSFQKNLFWLEKRGYSQGTWAEFIRMWINKFAQRNLR
nr:MAG TPA: hypothetical protein [Bacteriophage sp.]